MGLMEGIGKLDSVKCIDISIQLVLREMVMFGVIVIVMFIFMGFLLGVEVLGGMLMGAILVGVLLVLFMFNGGGVWDNVKKYVEGG